MVGELKFKREQLSEKLKQLQLLLRMNDGQLPTTYQQWARGEEFVDRSTDVIMLRR
jgi:hypothetical protein